jgi:hypothetical protein
MLGMPRVPRLLLLIVTMSAGLLAAAGPAEATLVPGELRFGPTSADPLVPLFDSASPLETSLGLRELPGGAPTLAWSGGATAVTCKPLPAGEVFATPGLSSNGPVAGQQLYATASDCNIDAVGSQAARVSLYGDPLGSFAMRAEANRRGGRDGILEPQPGRPFRVKLDVDDPAWPKGGCLWSIHSPTDPSAPTRIDVYNPGHGHKIDFENEPLTLVSGDSICQAATNFVFSAEVRLRGYDASATGPNSPWTKPVWLLPRAGGSS